MFLKRIEISGFKSFARKTVLEFSGASGGFPLTAIVGPNGSGKSNVADAIRWTIGEQSAKHLRGKKSEDVIFAGTGTKARLGSASVSLFFDNSDKKIPVEYAEVVITRRLFRNGESEYLINGARVRLLDVTDLLAQASIGKDGYSVITQGMSDAVLSATPLERRMMLEEAAGVKQYRLEKERSLRKLESTRENLTRVDALLVEIEPHLKNLKRQAEKASRGAEVAENLRTKQTQRFAFLWHTFEKERKEFEGKFEIESARLHELEQQSERINHDLVEESKRIEAPTKDGSEQKVRALRESLYTVERDISVLLGKREVEEERRKPREVVESVAVDREFVQKHLAEIRSHQEKLIDRLSHVESLDELQELRELARVIQTRLSELHGHAGAGTVVTKHMVEISAEELAKSDERLDALRTEETRLSEKKRSLQEKITEEERVAEEERRRLEESRRKFFELERKARDMQMEMNRLKDAENERKVRRARVEVREEDLTKEILEELRMKPEELMWNGETLDAEKFERDIIRLKVELEHIGSIDPMVIEECTETEKRFAFLLTESGDLKKAMQSLRQVVREMDTKIHTAFEIAWKEVHREFDRYFKIIFGGGEAKLLKIPVERRGSAGIFEDASEEKNADLSDDGEASLNLEKNEIDIGIDIVASPPGKKIGNLAMLSGGERSLTALALLFAIISHNPPPFAVLDEVEAALDEANSKRFSDLLSELSERTQFVAITHNRETMRRASILYGVTMGDDGISKILSVRLDQIGTGGKIRA
ncbi:MAG: AAA family ATPase, partial [Candidatus Moraniibacteriota bacterium]